MSSQSELTLPASVENPSATRGSIYFIGTATVLIRAGGFTVLTDPNFIHRHERVYLGNGLHATRQTDPAIDIEELPPIDLVLLSHFHGDHFDQVAEQKLDKALPIVTTPEAAEQLRERGFTNLYPLEKWSDILVKKDDSRLRITSVPGRHGPPGASLVLPDVMGSVLEYERSGDDALLRMYITGDTLVIDDLKQLPARYPELDLALLHLGGTRVLGVLVTMDAEQGVELLRIVQPKLAIPIHYNDYDVFKSPLEDFQREVQSAGLAGTVRYLSHGESHELELPA